MEEENDILEHIEARNRIRETNSASKTNKEAEESEAHLDLPMNQQSIDELEGDKGLIQREETNQMKAIGIEVECINKTDDSLVTEPNPECACSRIIGQNVGGGV